jgi:ubiquinone biosynthesis protein UbiJ
LASGGTGRRGGGRVEVSGDATVGQRFAESFKALDLDWEEPLAKTFGDVAGHHMAKFVRSAAAFGMRASDSFSHSLSEYLTEETGWVLGRNELNDFYDQVDELREDVDRLEARVKRLRRRR